MGCGGASLSAHAPPEPITWRRLRGPGAPRVTCLPVGRGRSREAGTAPPRGRGLGRGGGCWAGSRRPWRTSNFWPCYPGDPRRGGYLTGWGRGAVRTLGETNEKTRPGTRGRCRASRAHLRPAARRRHREAEAGSGPGGGGVRQVSDKLGGRPSRESGVSRV